jgi:hypothetical protein
MSPDLQDLVGDEGTPEERKRLERVHELLVAAGPPPELSPRLESPPSAGTAEVRFLPRRRRQALALVAAALVAVAFGVGYLVGNNGSTVQTSRVVAMHGVGRLASATGSVRIGEPDEYGNWPLVFSARGLRHLPRGGWYVLYLTKNGKIDAPCGTFNADGGETTVRLSVPYDLQLYNGWVVTSRVHGKKSGILLRTNVI